MTDEILFTLVGPGIMFGELAFLFGLAALIDWVDERGV